MRVSGSQSRSEHFRLQRPVGVLTASQRLPPEHGMPSQSSQESRKLSTTRAGA